MDKSQILLELVGMSAVLGRPENDYVILGQGNTSARVSDESFYVKASGSHLAKSATESFVEVRFEDILKILENGSLTDADVRSILAEAREDKSARMPSIETVFHAYLLSLPGVLFVGHTHPTDVNTILCSNAARELVESRIFPDEAIYCGLRPLYVPYADPGVSLARAIRGSVEDYIKSDGCAPKVILLQNHGMIALGETSEEVTWATAMWARNAKVLIGAYSLGGIHTLDG